MSLFAYPARADKGAQSGEGGNRGGQQAPPPPHLQQQQHQQQHHQHQQHHHNKHMNQHQGGQSRGGNMYYHGKHHGGGRHQHHRGGDGGHRGGGGSHGGGMHRPHGDVYHRGVVRVYDMRSLSAALEAAKPGCGEIRRILTSSAFRPRLPGLTKLVSRLSREGHWQKGLEVFEALPHMGLTPDTTITNAAISACDRGGQWERALHIFDEMDHHGLCRDTITYSSVISALSKGRQCNMAIEVFNHMMKAGVQPDAVTCCSLIAALDKGGMWQLAEQVFISMYADHPKFQVLLLMMDDASLPSDLQGASSLPLSKGASAFNILGNQSTGLTMDRQYSTPVTNFSTLETLHEGVADSWAENKNLPGRLSPKLNRKGANRSPPIEPVRRAVSAHSAYGTSGLSPIQQYQKMEEQRLRQASASAAPSPEAPHAQAGNLQALSGLDVGSEGGLSRDTGGASLQKIDVVSGLSLPSVDELEVDNMADLLTQISVSQGGSLPQGLPASTAEASRASPLEKTQDDAAKKASSLSPGAPDTQVSAPESLSPVVVPPPGMAPQPIGTPPPMPRKRSGSGRLSPQQGGRMSPSGMMTPPGASAGMTSAFAAAASPVGLQPAAGNPAQGQSNQISPFTNAKAIGDNIFGGPTGGQQASLSVPQTSPVESAFQAKANEPPPPAPMMHPQTSVSTDIRRALSGLTESATIELQQVVSGMDMERAMSAMAGMPDIQKAMSGLPNAVHGDSKADVLRTLSVNLDSMVGNQGSHHASMVQGYGKQMGGMVDRSGVGAGQSPFGNANLQQSGFQGTAMSRASSCPAPGVLLRTTSISNRKTAPNRVCCNALLAAYARANPPQWLKALRLLELMWECSGEVCPDIVSYNTVMKACGNAQQLDIAFEVYHSMRVRSLEPSIATFGTLITVASDAQRYDRVIEVWGWLQQSGLELNITCANAFLSALEKEGRWDDALEFFQSILSMTSKVRPNAVTFNIIMSSYQKRGQPDKVVYVFEDMYSAGVDPSIVTYNTLISAYGQMGDWVKAMEVLQHLIQSDRGIHPTLATFNQVQAALSEGALRATNEDKHKIAECSWRVFQHMVTASGVQPDMVTYNTIITTLQRVGNNQMVRKLINIMNSGIVEGLRNPDSERLVPA